MRLTLRLILLASATTLGVALFAVGAYTFIPAYQAYRETYNVFSKPEVARALATQGLDSDGVTQGAFIAALKVQAVLTYATITRGHSVNVLTGDGWHISDSHVSKMLAPDNRSQAMFNQYCSNGRVSGGVLYVLAKEGFTNENALGADKLRARQEMFETVFSGDMVESRHVVSTPFWKIPHLGFFSGAGDRAPIDKAWPQAQLSCDSEEGRKGDLAKTMDIAGVAGALTPLLDQKAALGPFKPVKNPENEVDLTLPREDFTTAFAKNSTVTRAADTKGRVTVTLKLDLPSRKSAFDLFGGFHRQFAAVALPTTGYTWTRVGATKEIAFFHYQVEDTEMHLSAHKKAEDKWTVYLRWTRQPADASN